MPTFEFMAIMTVSTIIKARIEVPAGYHWKRNNLRYVRPADVGAANDGCVRVIRSEFRWRVQASRVADAALAPTPEIVSRVQAANIFRLLLVIGLFPFLFSVCRSFQTITRSITSNAKRTPKPTHAARVELAPTDPTRLNPPTVLILS